MLITEKFEKASLLDKLIDKNKNRLEKLKVELFKELNERFPLIIDRKNDKNDLYKSFELMSEMQILLRSMLKTDIVIKIPKRKKESYSSYPEYNLTVKHGLKWPRCWKNYDFLPNRWSDEKDIEQIKVDDLVYKTNREDIDFSVLKDNKLIDQKKLMEFLEFIKKILELWKFYMVTNKLLDKEDSKFKVLESLSEWNSLDHFKPYIELIDDIEKLYSSYSDKIKSFTVKQDKLLAELYEFNKPFKIFLKLKESSTSNKSY